MSLIGSLFGKTQSSTTQEVNTPLDLATYAGSLASNPADVDPLLDTVRKITATHSPEAGLTQDDENELFRVYLELEKYLTTRDPIRTFTKEELRSRFNPDLSSKLAAHEA